MYGRINSELIMSALEARKDNAPVSRAGRIPSESEAVEPAREEARETWTDEWCAGLDEALAQVAAGAVRTQWSDEDFLRALDKHRAEGDRN
jgi:Arc/MetJ-type ribon-helix-helix transcriptional regulator